MKVAGIDVGSRYVHVYLMEIAKPKIDYVIEQIHDPNTPTPKGLLKYALPTGTNPAEIAERAYDEALTQTKLQRSDVERVWATGTYRKQAKFAHHFIPDAIANTHGVLLKVRNAKTILDVGEIGCRVIRISREGKVLDIAVSDNGTVGMGSFNEFAAKALELTLPEMSESSLSSTSAIFSNGRYKTFGESEVVSLISQKVSKNDIARAVYDAIAARVASVAQTTGLEDDIAIVGGMAKNNGFVAALKQAIGREIQEPHNPDFVCSFGAAVAAAAGEIDEEVRMINHRK
jgi:predicted CoA-substrate-specific enzyme activase